MGIRFRCHHCEHELNLKEFQGGKRARCPECAGRFRVPTVSTDFSLALEESEMVSGAALTPGQTHAATLRSNEPSFELSQPLNDPEALPQTRRSSRASDSPASSSSQSRDQRTRPAAATSTTKPNVSKQTVSKQNISKQSVSKQSSGSERSADVQRSASHKANPAQPANQAKPQQPAVAPNAGQPGMPRAIADAPQAVWYVRPPGGGQYGPADGHIFYQWLTDSRITPDSLVWRDGWPQWQSAGDAFEDHFGSAWRLATEATATELSHAAAHTGHSIAPGDITVRESVSGAEGTVTDYLPQEVEQPLRLSADNYGEDNYGESAPATRAISTAEPAASAPTLSVAEARRRKKRTQYGIMIAVLSVLALVLLAVFVMVIFGGAKVN